MTNQYKKNAKLVLSNGIVFPGFFFGASGTAIGEIVFNTGMTGYQEVITDPSYFGQILTFTYPEIGNTGINSEDSESTSSVKGIIIRNYDGVYKLNGKSYDVLRSKEFKTEYFKIVDAKKGLGSQENSVIWILQCMINTKKTFNAIPYGSIKEREFWLKNYKKYLNKMVKVKYITKDNNGCVVRNPIVIME